MQQRGVTSSVADVVYKTWPVKFVSKEGTDQSLTGAQSLEMRGIGGTAWDCCASVVEFACRKDEPYLAGLGQKETY